METGKLSIYCSHPVLQLRKTPLSGALLSYLHGTTAAICPELLELSTSENLAQVVMLKWDEL